MTAKKDIFARYLSERLETGKERKGEILDYACEVIQIKISGMRPDTGGEFINWFLKKWRDEEKIELTRSRPNHKNDNAFAEQKNGHVIRRFLGYVRFDCFEAAPIMNKFYDCLEVCLEKNAENLIHCF